MDSFRSPLGSESQDEWGSGLWMEAENDSADERGSVDPRAPHAQEEDTHSVSPEQQQTGRESPSGATAADFPSPPFPSAVGDGVMEENSSLAGMDNEARDQEWPPVPGPADTAAQMFVAKHSDSSEGSDSIVFLSEDSEEQGIDCAPLDFTSARDQWIRRDSSSSKPPTPAFSRSSSTSLITEEHPDGHQGEPYLHNPVPNTEDQEVQQVRNPTPPLETVAGEQGANPDPGSPTCSAIVVTEPLTEAAGGRREGRRESEQTEGERKQSVSGSARADTGRESRAGDPGTAVKTPADAQRAEGPGRMDPDQYEDSQSDSGVSADFSPNSTTDISSTPIASSPDLNETPIEREIRLSIKREQSLRRSRGMKPVENKEKEFVEIPVRKSILSKDVPHKSVKSEGKDRQFAGKKMQREIRAEAERERALVQLGRLPGFYDKGTVKQLREKKLLFEAFQEPKEPPEILTKRPASVTSCEISNGGTQLDLTSGFLKERSRSFEYLDQDPNSNYSTVDGLAWTSSGRRGPGLTEGSKGQVIILESTPSALIQVERFSNRSATAVDRSGRSFSVKTYCDRNQDEGGDSDKESPGLNENPFFKLRSSLPLRPDVEQDIRVAREREKELRKQRTSLYGSRSEVEGAKSPTNPLSAQRNRTTPVRQSLGKLDLTWPPPPLQDEHRAQLEVQKSPKRQKSVLLQRWENGLVNGHGEQQE